MRVVDFERLSEEPPIDVSDAYCALGTTIKRAGSQAAFRQVDSLEKRSRGKVPVAEVVVVMRIIAHGNEPAVAGCVLGLFPANGSTELDRLELAAVQEMAWECEERGVALLDVFVIGIDAWKSVPGVGVEGFDGPVPS